MHICCDNGYEFIAKWLKAWLDDYGVDFGGSTESSDRYDLIGIDTACTDETVKARKPKEPNLFKLLGLV
jgi:hypothetical protein